MRRIPLSLLAFVLAASAHAAPTDETEGIQARHGLMDRIEHVRHSVSDRTSELVLSAMGFLGVPYRRGGNSVETGFDCSGFVRAMYDKSVGKLLPRRAEEQAAATEKIDRSELRPGDLVFFNTMRRAFSHVGIYIGDGKFIHSPRTGAEVRVESMNVSYWQRRFNGARRVIEDGASGE
ncbi:C40 family peptidase [Xenophilus azovorans]|uniref:C40 family peptidase n=1 Tax=Xenophilus azovorans TaxID=151755 RepID=UPI0005708AE9|nr:C40 family peptidase [Xenophilus azovorans]